MNFCRLLYPFLKAIENYLEFCFKQFLKTIVKTFHFLIDKWFSFLLFILLENPIPVPHILPYKAFYFIKIDLILNKNKNNNLGH